MTPFFLSFLSSKGSAFLVGRDGSAAIEFALISTVLTSIMAGILDVSFMVAASRDAERGSALIAKSLSSCPPATTANEGLTHRGSDCVKKTMDLYTGQNVGRLKNILVGIPNAKVDTIYYTMVNTVPQTCTGTVDFVNNLGDKVNKAVKSISQNDDTGVAVKIVTSYTPFLPKFVVQYVSSAGLIYEQYTVDNQGSGPAARCSKS